MNIIIEPTFEVVYALIGLFLSIFVLIKGRKKSPYIILASIGFSIVVTDSMTIIPNYLGLSFVKLENFYEILGIGKAAISITLTLLYLSIYILYKIIKRKETPILIDITLYVLAASKIIISLIPITTFEIVNNYFLISFIGNIPFIFLGLLVALYTFKWTSVADDELFEKLSILFAEALLSFTFVVVFNNYYIPLIITVFTGAILLFPTNFIGYQTIKKIE